MDVNQLEMQYERNQMHLFIGAIVGLTGMVISDIAESLNASGAWAIPLSVITLIGWGVFIVAAFRLRGLVNNRNGEVMSGAIDDERVQLNRKEAFSFGFSAVLGWLVVVAVGTPWLERFSGYLLTADLAADIGIAIAIAASLGKFLYLQRQ